MFVARSIKAIQIWRWPTSSVLIKLLNIIYFGEVFMYKHKGYARLQNLIARLTTRANDNHAAPDSDLYLFNLTFYFSYKLIPQILQPAVSE